MTPENSTQTGDGATAWASASQKWNGTTAPLTRKPNTTSTKATTTRPSTPCSGRARPMAARFRAPVRAYSRAMPDSTISAPTLLVMAKFSAPCSGPGSSAL